MKDMYGIRADELDMHSIIAESIIGFLLQHTGIKIQRQDISMNSSVCAAAVPLLPRFGTSPESLLNECEKTECGLPYSNMRKYRGINIFEQVSAKNGYLCFNPTNRVPKQLLRSMHGAASNAGNAAKNCFSVQHGICLRTAFDLLLLRLPLHHDGQRQNSIVSLLCACGRV